MWAYQFHEATKKHEILIQKASTVADDDPDLQAISTTGLQ